MNRFVLFGLALAAIVAVGLSELCTPDQWEGYEASIGGYVHHRRPGIIQEHNYVAYDFTNKKKASFITYRNNDYQNKFQIIIRYDDDQTEGGKVYYVDLKKDKCWIKNWDKPFRKACLPDDAKKHPEFTIGPLKGGLKVAGYSVRKGDADVFISAVTSGNTIIPVTENVHGDFMSTSFIQGIQYADISAGIKNESIFDIPKQCSDETFFDSTISEYLTREHFVLAV